MTAAGAAGLVLSTRALDTDAACSVIARPRLLRILRDADAVRVLGKCYREMTPSEDDVRVLEHSIVGTSGALPASLSAEIDARVQCDFAEGRTVTLDGWVLALTEARQCALFSLMPA